MAKHARGKHRDADIGRVALRGKADELAERHFRDVPLAVLDEAEEDFLDVEREGGERDPVGAHGAGNQVAHMVVVGDGKRQVEPRRTAALDELRLAIRDLAIVVALFCPFPGCAW